MQEKAFRDLSESVLWAVGSDGSCVPWGCELLGVGTALAAFWPWDGSLVPAWQDQDCRALCAGVLQAGVVGDAGEHPGL